MEKVWDELKKIDAKADQIQIDAQEKAKKIANLAKEDVEKLIDNGKIYAEEEGRKLYLKSVQDATQKREELLRAGEKKAAKLKAQAEKRMDQAVLLIVDAVLEENKP
jgi:vacuolar-type H+-ATPase subunit H